MKTYNLNKQYKWRGDIAELLAKHEYKTKRTQGYDFRKDSNLSAKDNAFLNRFWSKIDLYGCDVRDN